MDHGVGGRQVQAHTAGLEADQKDLQLAILEILHRCAAVAGFAGEDGVGDPALLQFGFDQCKHGGELREQQDAPAFGNQFVEHFQQAAELARAACAGRGGAAVDQAQVAAHLA
ncbi:hypothetical protein D3C81_1942380 [compost metagenome]